MWDRAHRSSTLGRGGLGRPSHLGWALISMQLRDASGRAGETGRASMSRGRKMGRYWLFCCWVANPDVPPKLSACGAVVMTAINIILTSSAMASRFRRRPGGGQVANACAQGSLASAALAPLRERIAAVSSPESIQAYFFCKKVKKYLGPAPLAKSPNVFPKYLGRCCEL